jgi:hypothetical protein
MRTLIEHWNGRTWTAEKSPDPGGSSNDNALYGVAAISATNAWAVGDYYNAPPDDRALIEHWNGKTWTAQTSPAYGWLSSVTATSSTSAWAVGDIGTGTA